MAKEQQETKGIPFPAQPPPGAILTEEEILDLVERGSLITQDTFDKKGLDCCSYDIRLGSKALLGGQAVQQDLTKQPLVLSPGGYVAVISLEKVSIPSNMVARINSKRRVAYEGIALLTGTQVDPGYKGHLLFGMYNVSSRRIILSYGQPICGLVFETLTKEVSRPKQPDPYLLDGEFPPSFVKDMANMEVLTLNQLSEEVKKIEVIAKDILDLRAKYEDVVTPIKTLTENIQRVTTDVDKLRESLQILFGGVEQAKTETKLLSEAQTKHEDKITALTARFGVFSIVVYIIISLLVFIAGGFCTTYVWPKLFAGAPSQQSAPVTPVPPAATVTPAQTVTPVAKP